MFSFLSSAGWDGKWIKKQKRREKRRRLALLIHSTNDHFFTFIIFFSCFLLSLFAFNESFEIQQPVENLIIFRTNWIQLFSSLSRLLLLLHLVCVYSRCQHHLSVLLDERLNWISILKYFFPSFFREIYFWVGRNVHHYIMGVELKLAKSLWALGILSGWMDEVCLKQKGEVFFSWSLIELCNSGIAAEYWKFPLITKIGRASVV